MSEALLSGVLEEFGKLAAIPRPSKHEERIGNYLRGFFEAQGLTVAQDAFKNIIAEVPASSGKENAPLTILQAHTDMVCVAAAGVKFNPLTDPIKLVRDEKFLSAAGTSLGADDGIGVAEILWLVKNREQFPHGRLRLIFTADEEQDMGGAVGLDKKFLIDAEFLLNLDSERFGEIVAGSAGSVHARFWRELHYVRPDTKLPNNILITIGGLRGGHSGEEIGGGRVNAIKIAAKILRQITRRGKIRLANLNGGRAFNVIPDIAEIALTTDLSRGAVAEICADTIQRLKNVYAATDPNIKIEARAMQRPDKVLHAKDYKSLENLLTLIHSGVYFSEPANPAQVFASANLGTVRINDSFAELKVLPRANADELIDDFIDGFEQAAQLCGFESEFSAITPAWKFNPASRLLGMAKDVFTEQNGHVPAIKTIHAGLETSFFVKKHPRLDVISTGTTNENIHSPNERLHLDTVEPHVKFIVALLGKIAQMRA